MVEVKDAEINRLQDLVSDSERHRSSDLISEQKNLASSMIENLSSACSDKAKFKEASEKIARLEDELEQANEKASSLLTKLKEADAKEKSTKLN